MCLQNLKSTCLSLQRSGLRRTRTLNPRLSNVPDPYAPPMLLPAFEDQDPPVMHPPHEEKSNNLHLTEKKSPKAAMPLLPTDDFDSGAPVASQTKGIAIGIHNGAPLVSRGFTTSTRRMKNLQGSPFLGGKQSYSTARSFSTRAAAGIRGNAKVRFLAVGIAVVSSVIMNGGGATALYRSDCQSPHATTSLAMPPSLFSLRAGEQQLGEDVPPPPLEFAHGTTTLSFVFQGGIIAAVDSRASLGNFVGSKTTQKVLPVNT